MRLFHGLRVWGRWNVPGPGRCDEFPLTWVKSVEYIGGPCVELVPDVEKKGVFTGNDESSWRVRNHKRRLDTDVRRRGNIL